MKNIGVYPGSFDPISEGHFNIIKRSLTFCDELHIVVGVNPQKKTMFNVVERIDLITKTVSFLNKGYLDKIKINCFNGLIIDFAKSVKANLLIRGIRSSIDFEYENNLALINKKIDWSIETIFLPTEQSLALVSSSTIKELVRLDVPIVKDMASAHVINAVKNKLKGINE